MASLRAILPRCRLLACRPTPTGMANSFSSTAISAFCATFIKRQFDSNVYSISPGVNWTLTSRCSGSLGGFFTRSPSTITELVGTGVNYATTTSLTETGKCGIANGFSVLFNSSVIDTTNSNPVDAVNNANAEMISAGIEYAEGQRHSERAGVKIRQQLWQSRRGAEHPRAGEHCCLPHLQREAIPGRSATICP